MADNESIAGLRYGKPAIVCKKRFSNEEKVVDKLSAACYYNQVVSEQTAIAYGRVVELVDSLDSGSSVHCGRAGSSPASPTKTKVYPIGYTLVFYVADGAGLE